MTNLSDLDVDSIQIALNNQALVADGAITITEGVVTMTRAGAIVAATLGAPTAGVDDFKRLTIVSKGAAGQAHTVTAVAGVLVATFSNVIGDCIDLIAYNGRWEIVGTHQVTAA